MFACIKSGLVILRDHTTAFEVWPAVMYEGREAISVLADVVNSEEGGERFGIRNPLTFGEDLCTITKLPHQKLAFTRASLRGAPMRTSGIVQ